MAFSRCTARSFCSVSRRRFVIIVSRISDVRTDLSVDTATGRGGQRRSSSPPYVDRPNPYERDGRVVVVRVPGLRDRLDETDRPRDQLRRTRRSERWRRERRGGDGVRRRRGE
ncbi:Uncharacterized protein PBTT_04977 [Plasmodiophora brassicae]